MYNGMFAQALGAGLQTLKKVSFFSSVLEFHSNVPEDAIYTMKIQIVEKQKYYCKALNTEEGEK